MDVFEKQKNVTDKNKMLQKKNKKKNSTQISTTRDYTN